jgi:oxalate decarboxylase/phosphoglucose isomerase-like protein (cupin superfamily)
MAQRLRVGDSEQEAAQLTRLIRFRTIADPTGNLTPFASSELPFPLAQVFTLHDVPGGARRGGHAHRRLEEVVIAASGSFDVLTVDEHGRHRFALNRATVGVYLPSNVWRELRNFSTNAVALVLMSQEYDESDYIRSFQDFLATLPHTEDDYFTRRARTKTLEELRLVER